MNFNKEYIYGRMTDSIYKLAERIAPIYELLNWDWGPKRGIPTENDIVQELKSLLLGCISEEQIKELMQHGGTIDAETGGLCFYMKYYIDDDEFIINVSFVVREEVNINTNEFNNLKKYNKGNKK